MTDQNPFQSSVAPVTKAKPVVTIPRDPRLASYCSFVGFTLFVVGLLLVWPAIYNLMMATDSIASIVRYSPPIVHFLFSLLFGIASIALLAAAVLTFKLGKYISLGDRPDFVLKVARVHLFYIPLGTILYLWLRSIIQNEKPAGN